MSIQKIHVTLPEGFFRWLELSPDEEYSSQSEACGDEMYISIGLINDQELKGSGAIFKLVNDIPKLCIYNVAWIANRRIEFTVENTLCTRGFNVLPQIIEEAIQAWRMDLKAMPIGIYAPDVPQVTYFI